MRAVSDYQFLEGSDVEPAEAIGLLSLVENLIENGDNSGVQIVVNADSRVVFDWPKSALGVTYEQIPSIAERDLGEMLATMQQLRHSISSVLNAEVDSKEWNSSNAGKAINQLVEGVREALNKLQCKKVINVQRVSEDYTAFVKLVDSNDTDFDVNTNSGVNKWGQWYLKQKKDKASIRLLLYTAQIILAHDELLKRARGTEDQMILENFIKKHLPLVAKFKSFYQSRLVSVLST